MAANVPRLRLYTAGRQQFDPTEVESVSLCALLCGGASAWWIGNPLRRPVGRDCDCGRRADCTAARGSGGAEWTVICSRVGVPSARKNKGLSAGVTPRAYCLLRSNNLSIKSIRQLDPHPAELIWRTGITLSHVSRMPAAACQHRKGWSRLPGPAGQSGHSICISSCTPLSR